MTLATATIERFTELASVIGPVTDTPVTREPTVEERRSNEFEHMLYVVSTMSADVESVAGTIQTVRTSDGGDGWFRLRNTGGSVQRCYGAVVNPPMVDGHYYRTLGGRNLTARYNDEDHRGDRHVGNLPLSMIAGDNAPWPFPGDGMAMWEGVPYIEVEAPAAASAVPATLEELTDAHQFVSDITMEGPTRGLAQAEPDGRVLLNPELAVGEMYLYWSQRSDWDNGSMVEARVITALVDGTPVFGYLGYWTMERVSGELVPYFYTNRRTVLDDTTDKGWAKLALIAPAVDDSEEATRIATLNRQLNEEGTAFSEFNEATNTLAEDNEWCSEYEDIVVKVGMEGRTKRLNDYDVEVTADFSFEADEVSSRMDNQIADDHDIPGFSGSSARYSGSATITIRVSEQESEDDARDYIDSDTVVSELDNMMSGADSIDVSDWNIRNVREV